MKKIVITGIALLFPALSYAATTPTVVVVNHVASDNGTKNTVIQIPVGQAVTLAKAAPGAALIQTHDEAGQVTQSTAAVVKPLFIEHITTMQARHGVSVTVTYTYNYTLGLMQSDESGQKTAVTQKQNAYTRTVTKDIPYGQVETVQLSLPPSAAGYDEIMHKLFPLDMFLTISATK